MRTLEERFWTKVDVRGPDECWPWIAYVDRFGYGTIWLEGKKHKAHRVVWELTFAPIPERLCCLHKCDSPGCVNPRHLFLGTIAENNADRDEKGRSCKGMNFNVGEQSGMSKLMADQVISIREAYARGGTTQRELAEQYNVSSRAIGLIVSRERWSHL